MKSKAFKMSSRRILFSTALATALVAGFPLPSEAEVLAVDGLAQSGGG